MKFNPIFLLIALLWCCAFMARAQNAVGFIKGKVTDGYGLSVPGAAAYLLNSKDSSLHKLSATNIEGIFAFNSLAAGTYLLKVSAMGFQTKLAGPYTIEKGIGIEGCLIKLMPAVKQLRQVDITGSKPLVEVKNGKTLINVQSSILLSGNTAFELLKKAPGVQIDNNDNIILNGRSNVLVMIDNKPTYLSNDALTELLQGTPGSIIDQVELISNPGAAYDAAGTGGIINIKLKKNENFGTNAAINSNIGLQQTGSGHHPEFKWGSSITFNHRNKLVNVFGNYGFSDIPVNKLVFIDRSVNYQSLLTQFGVNYFSQQHRLSNIFRLGADFNITKKSIIGVLLSGSYSTYINDENTITSISNQGRLDSTLKTNSDLDSRSLNTSVDLNYKASFGHWGDVSADFDYSRFDRKRLKLINSNYFSPASALPYRSLLLQDTYPTKNNIFTFNVDYKVSLNKTSVLRTIIKSTFVKTDNISNFGSVVNDTYYPTAKFTNKFNYTERIMALGVIYSKTISNKLNLDLGLRTEQTSTLAEAMRGLSVTPKRTSFIDLMPSLLLNNTIDKNNQVSLSIGRRIQRPVYEDLNPFVAYIDQYNYYMGNPALNPFYTNNIELTHTYRSKYSTTFRFSIVNNFAQTIYTQNDSAKIIVSSKTNVGDRYIYGILFNAPIDFAHWWNANLNIDASYLRFINTQASTYLNNASFDVILKLQQSFNLSNGYKAEVISKYETPTVYGIYNYKSDFRFDAAVSKSLFKKKGSIIISINDILNTEKDRVRSNYQNLNLSSVQKNAFRVFQIGFLYRFGSSTIKSERKRTTGAEEEEGRAVSAN